MGADHVAAIRPILEELDTADEAVALCATFTSADDEAAWIEVIPGAVNMAYPHEDDPLERLAQGGITPLPDLQLEASESGTYATFSYDESVAELADVAQFVDALFSTVLGQNEDYGLDVEIGELADDDEDDTDQAVT